MSARTFSTVSRTFLSAATTSVSSCPRLSQFSMGFPPVWLEAPYCVCIRMQDRLEGYVLHDPSGIGLKATTRRGSGACRKVFEVHGSLGIRAEVAPPTSEAAHDPQRHRRQAEAS